MSQDETNSDIRQIAESLIAEYSGLTPDAIIRIRHVCADRGMSQSETDEFLSQIGSSANPVEQSQPVQQSFQRASSSFAHQNTTADNNASVLSRPTQSFEAGFDLNADPGDTFLDWVKLEILKPPRMGITAESAAEIFNRGITELRISEVYASQLLVNACEFYRVEIPEFEGQVAPPIEEEKGEADVVAPVVSEFVDRVREIIAMHQGVNIQSRIKIDMEAKQRGLTQEQRQLGLTLAVEGPVAEAESDKHLDQRVDVFKVWARSIILLQQREGRILNGLIESMANESASRFGISNEIVRQSVSELADSNGLSIVHDDDAVDNFNQSIAIVLGDETSLGPELQQSLISKALRFGLDTETAQSEIHKAIARNQAMAQSEQSRTRGVLVTVALCSLLAIAAIVFVIVSLNDKPDGSGLQITDTNQTTGDTIVGQPIPDWWSEDLQADVESLLGISRAFTQTISLMMKEQDELRNAGYDKLVDSVFDGSLGHGYLRPSRVASGQTSDQEQNDHVLRLELLTRIIASCIVRDPSESVSEDLAGGILEFIDLSFVEIDGEDLLACKSMWAIDVFSSAWGMSEEQAEKQSMFAEKIQDQFGITATVGTPFDDLERRLSTIVRQNLIGELINQIQFAPDVAAVELVDLLLLQQDMLPAGEWENDVIRVLQLANPATLVQWQTYRSVYEACLQSENSSTILGLIKLQRILEADPIRSEVLSDLANLTGYEPERQASPSEHHWGLFKTFCLEQLGKTSPMGTLSGWLRQADRTIERQAEIPAAQDAMLDVIAYLQFNSALGSSLVFDETLYQNINDERPHPLTPSMVSLRHPDGGRGLVGTLNLLSNATTDSQKSDLYLAMMQEENLRALPSNHATTLAKLLLEKQSDEIGNQIMEMAEFFRTSPFLLSNLSSVLHADSLTMWHRDLVHALLDQPIAASDPNEWCNAAKTALLKRAMIEIQKIRQRARSTKLDFIEEATGLLCVRYRDVLRLTGGEGQRPGESMSRIALEIARREQTMRGPQLDLDDELAALELSRDGVGNDIELYVLSTRCMVRCLGYSISSSEPSLKEIIELRLDSLEEKLRSSSSIEEQLYFVEHSALEIWMIRVMIGALAI